MDYTIICKYCGGENVVKNTEKTFVCAYCEMENTIARNMDTRGNLFNRANYLRQNGEFDNAIAVYEEILRGDNTEYEAHWGLVLCRYGIEYVEDTAGKRVPTLHRMQNEAITNDLEYRAACEYAPYEVRTVYEQDGAYISGVLDNLKKVPQEQFDVFLCYKETDAARNRSQDSVLAGELEFELAKRGYKVFFARKTLENKLGTAYEPVIFSALHSARVMVVLGTKPEHFTAVWVKNEWSRYRELIRKGEAKTIIPAYTGMSPYDLPREFADLQALDMGKLGFVQDLCYGIDRINRSNNIIKKTPDNIEETGIEKTNAIYKRIRLFLEERDFEKADKYLEDMLDMDAEDPRAYIGKLMVQLKITEESKLREHSKSLSEYPLFQKALRFATQQQNTLYTGYNNSSIKWIEETNEREKQEKERQKQLLLKEKGDKLAAILLLYQKAMTLSDSKDVLELKRFSLGIFEFQHKKSLDYEINLLQQQIYEIEVEINGISVEETFVYGILDKYEYELRTAGLIE